MNTGLNARRTLHDLSDDWMDLAEGSRTAEERPHDKRFDLDCETRLTPCQVAERNRLLLKTKRTMSA